eukprot:snap_masked-scaffold_117-processed-gene-0.8-mRNA-1 protein AED:0.16 eAED:1.00 QI:0/0/0/1/1/1/2/0/565
MNTVHSAFPCSFPDPTPEPNSVLFLPRGNCTYHEKALLAQSLKVNALIVYNTEDSMFSNRNIKNACDIDCKAAKDVSKDECQKKCETGLCLQKINGESSFCCTRDELLVFDVQGDENTSLDFPVLSMKINDGKTVKALFQGSLLFHSVFSMNKEYFEQFDTGYSVFFMWLFVSLMFPLVVFLSIKKERELTKELEKKLFSNSALDETRNLLLNKSKEDEHDEEELNLDFKSSLSFLAVSSFSLLGLYVLVKFFPYDTTLMLIYLFAFASIFVLAESFVSPCLQHIFKSTPHNNLILLVSSFLSLIFLISRHPSSNFEFYLHLFLQNLISICLAISFLEQIKLNSASNAYKLLSLFFLYDIFMTFLTPLFFKESVMMSVATAANEMHEKTTQSLICKRTLPEQLPMVFLFPNSLVQHFYTFETDISQHRTSLLGLGDVFIPGLFVSFLFHVDLLNLQFLEVKKKKTKWRYKWTLAGFLGYMIGFAMTLFANVNQISVFGVKGQPALMYLVPCLYLSVFLVKKILREELPEDLHVLKERRDELIERQFEEEKYDQFESDEDHTEEHV